MMNTAPTLAASRKDQLGSILEMSLSMLDLAREQSWDALDALEAERRSLVNSCFQATAGAQEADMMADYIGKILDVNREITRLTEQGRDEAGRAIRALDSGKKAQQAYSQHAR